MLKGAKTWSEMREGLPVEDRETIAERVRQIRRAARLQDIREIADKKQADVAGMSQVSVSRLEGREDWLVSSINSYVRGLGGTLKIVADMPDLGEIELVIDRDGKIAATVDRRSLPKRPTKAQSTPS